MDFTVIKWALVKRDIIWIVRIGRMELRVKVAV